jgi:multidrug efflux pump subunit AcrA (membrane-fusion protein)
MPAPHDQRMTETKSPSSIVHIVHSANTPPGTTAARKARPSETGSRRSQRQIFGFATLFLIGAVTVGAYQPWQSLPADSPSAEHSGEPRLKTVNVVQPAPAATSEVVLPASFRPWQAATLHARVSGFLAKWHHDLGDSVKAGNLLAEIETPELDQELAEGEALAREAAAGAVQARAELQEAQADLKVAEAQLGRVQADLALAKSQHVRREVLIKNRAISQEEYDTYQRQLEAREADVTAAQSDVARRKANLTTRAAIIEVREATAKSRQSNVDRLQELQRFKRIIAPFDGVVTSRSAEVGMLVTAGQESLFVVEDLSRIRVQVNVPQTYAQQTAPGIRASVVLPESNLPPVAGQITRIAQSVDPASRTMLAEIEIDNTVYQFQPGSYSQVRLALPQHVATWTIPTNTLSMRVDGPHIAIVNDEQSVEWKRVLLGRDLGNRIVVTEGIEGHERLVVNPGDGLVSGDRVEIDNSKHSAPRLAQR